MALHSPMKTLDAGTTGKWRAWLRAHHATASEIWLVFHKRHTGRPSIEYEDAVNEALCFGWVDSLIKRLDDDRYARKFTPRKPNSRWSTANRKRYARLRAEGRLSPAGLTLAPTSRSGDAPRPSLSRIPRFVRDGLERHPAARRNFESLAPSHQRQYLGWIVSAKQEATRARRLQEAIKLLTAGDKLGLK